MRESNVEENFDECPVIISASQKLDWRVELERKDLENEALAIRLDVPR